MGAAKMTSALRPIIVDMLDGFATLDEQLATEAMSRRQRAKFTAMVAGAVALRYTWGLARPHIGGGFDITDGLDSFTGHTLSAKGTRRADADGGHYFTDAEVAAFERSGIAGPFTLMDRSDALDVKALALELHERNWDNQLMLGDRVASSLQRHGQWGLDYSGMYQALNHRELWDLVVDPQVTHRVASLLGDDLICWRSQFFEKRPGARGTFWHQAGAFRETSKAAKLVPTASHADTTNNGMLQLSLWLALDDATVDNGTLRFLGGSFTDSRLEEIGNRILDNPVDVLASLGVRDIAQAIRVLQFTANDFIKSQLAFEYATRLLPDLFEGTEPITTEVEAGQFILFTSVNMHASWPNTTPDQTRLAFGGRYTTGDVAVYQGFDHDTFPTPDGYLSHSIDELACIQVHGTDTHRHNNIRTEPPAPR